MPPVLPTTSVFEMTQADTLEHGSLLLLWIVLLATAAESPGKVMVVLVSHSCELSSHVPFQSGGSIATKCTGCRLGSPSGAAVAFEVAFREELHKLMLTMA